MTSIREKMTLIGRKAKEASQDMKKLSSQDKSKILMKC